MTAREARSPKRFGAAVGTAGGPGRHPRAPKSGQDGARERLTTGSVFRSRGSRAQGKGRDTKNGIACGVQGPSPRSRMRTTTGPIPGREGLGRQVLPPPAGAGCEQNLYALQAHPVPPKPRPSCLPRSVSTMNRHGTPCSFRVLTSTCKTRHVNAASQPGPGAQVQRACT